MYDRKNSVRLYVFDEERWYTEPGDEDKYNHYARLCDGCAETYAVGGMWIADEPDAICDICYEKMRYLAIDVR